MSEKRLLVIDDEPEIGEFVRKVATGLGYEVRVTTDGHAFQEAYREFCPTTSVSRILPHHHRDGHGDARNGR